MGITTYTPDSNRIIHKSLVDFSYRPVSNEIHMVQYDNKLPILEVKLFSSGEPYILPDSASVRVRWGKKDNTFVYKEVLGCNSERNTIYFEVDEQMSYFHGPLDPILELVLTVDDIPLKAGSSPIPVIIDRNPVQDYMLESEQEFSILEQLIADANKAIDDANEALETATTVLDDTKRYRDEAEAFKDQSIGSAMQSQSYMAMAQTAMNDAIIAKQEAQTAMGQAMMAKDEANVAKQQAQISAGSAFGSATAAETARNAAQTANTAAQAAKTAAETAKTAAQTANTAAQAAKTAAETAAATATTKASEAAASATAANTAKVAAETAKTNATTEANRAKTEADRAKDIADGVNALEFATQSEVNEGVVTDKPVAPNTLMNSNSIVRRNPVQTGIHINNIPFGWCRVIKSVSGQPEGNEDGHVIKIQSSSGDDHINYLYLSLNGKTYRRRTKNDGTADTGWIELASANEVVKLTGEQNVPAYLKFNSIAVDTINTKSTGNAIMRYNENKVKIGSTLLPLQLDSSVVPTFNGNEVATVNQIPKFSRSGTTLTITR